MLLAFLRVKITEGCVLSNLGLGIPFGGKVNLPSLSGQGFPLELSAQEDGGPLHQRV